MKEHVYFNVMSYNAEYVGYENG